MSSIITLTLPGDPLFTRLATQTATSLADVITGDERHEPAGRDFSHAFELALSEAFTNSAIHGRDCNAPSTVTLTYTIEERQLTISIRDTNDPFVLETPTPDVERYPENGYGLMIIRKVMDSVSYQRDGGSNILSMAKTF